MIKLGSKVKDSITGLAGIATGRCEFLHGPVRWQVEPPLRADGKPVDGQWFDEGRLEVVA
jgi:hypothetical protein